MRIYADRPKRQSRQLAADLLGVSWCVAWFLAGLGVRNWIRARTGPADAVEGGSDRLADALRELAEAISEVPVLGDTLAAAVDRAADAAAALSTSGAGTATSIERIGDAMGLMIVALAVAPAAYLWLRPRMNWYHEATAARAALRRPDRFELLSAQALSTVDLRQVGAELLAGWRVGDPDAFRALARAELDRLGLAYPPDLSPSSRLPSGPPPRPPSGPRPSGSPPGHDPAGQGSLTRRSAS
jgi:hypothetical protein